MTPFETVFRFLFFALFFFLCSSMFFNRIAQRFGYTFPLKFIGVQIGLSVVAVFLHGVMFWGIRAAFLFICTSTGIGLLAESLGSSRGWIFGRYRYTKKSGPKLFRSVSVFVPFMWCVIAYMGFWTAGWIVPASFGRSFLGRTLLILAASLLVTLWDLVADPLMVFEGAWIWEKKGKYFGIPVSNFVGWFIISFLIYTVFVFLAGDQIFISNSPDWISYLPAFGYCMLTGVFSRACFERRLRLPGMIGFITVLVLLIVGAIRLV